MVAQILCGNLCAFNIRFSDGLSFSYLYFFCDFNFFIPSAWCKKSYDDIFKSVFGRVPEKQYFSQQMGLIIDHEYVADDIEVLVPSVGSDFKLFSYQILNYLHQNQKPGTVKDVTKKLMRMVC